MAFCSLFLQKCEGKGKLESGKTLTYGKVCNVEYVRVDEGNIVIDCCHPKILRKDIQTKNNLIVVLCLYVTGEMMIT